MTGVSLRPLRADDVDTAVELFREYSAFDNRVNLRTQLTDDDSRRRAVVAERAGSVIAAAAITGVPALPRVGSARVAVRHDERGAGTGTALARALAGGLDDEPVFDVVTCALRDDRPGGRRFAERHGFTVTNHHVGWGIDPAAPRSRPGAPAGVRIRVADVAAEKEGIIDCVLRCLPGYVIPFGEPRPVDAGAIARLLPPDAVVLVAEDEPGGRARGVTAAARKDDDRLWQVMFTGVEPGRRRRGIAGALTSSLLSAGADRGVASIVSHNDATNEPMNRINRSLGMTGVVGYWSLARTGVNA